MVKNLPAIQEAVGLIPRSGKAPGVGNGNPLQYPCLGNSWTGEPRGLQSMKLQRVRHDLITLITLSLTYSTVCKDDKTFMLRMCAVLEHGSPVFCFVFSPLSMSTYTFGWGAP